VRRCGAHRRSAVAMRPRRQRQATSDGTGAAEPARWALDRPALFTIFDADKDGPPARVKTRSRFVDRQCPKLRW